MHRLNCYNSYQNKPFHHEDQLTRAYLVLLRYSSHALNGFYELCKPVMEQDDSSLETPGFIDLAQEDWTIETQRSNPQIETARLLSVLITDEQPQAAAPTPVEADDRNARYDGLLQFGDKLTIIIEVKPRSEDVWFNQLNPTQENLSSETYIYKNPVHLTWKRIVRQLNSLLNYRALTETERNMIVDFLDLVTCHFGHLNPYDNLSLCKNNPELIQRRITQILKEVALHDDLVRYHRGWGQYIQLPFPDIRKIGLIFSEGATADNWQIELYFSYGDTQGQAKAFYNGQPDLTRLKDQNWIIQSNFHFSFQSTNLLYLYGSDFKRYINYWTQNHHILNQHPKEQITGFVEDMLDAQIINNYNNIWQDLDDKILSKGYTVINICPGLGLTYTLKVKEAETLDKQGLLTTLIKDKITEALSIANHSTEDVLK
jgi:hypothetical protein